MPDARATPQSCLRSNAAWRRQAANLRTHAALTHLTDQQRATLLGEAEAAERQVDMWLAGTIEARRLSLLRPRIEAGRADESLRAHRDDRPNRLRPRRVCRQDRRGSSSRTPSTGLTWHASWSEWEMSSKWLVRKVLVSAENRNPHRSSPASRGFVPQRLL
jgi:hypothetical protein